MESGSQTRAHSFARVIPIVEGARPTPGSVSQHLLLCDVPSVRDPSVSPSAYSIQLVPFMGNNGSKTQVSVTENRRSVARWPEPRGSSAQTERAIPALISDADVGGRPQVFSAFQRVVHTLWALVLGSLPLLYLSCLRCFFVVPVWPSLRRFPGARPHIASQGSQRKMDVWTSRMFVPCRPHRRV